MCCLTCPEEVVLRVMRLSPTLAGPQGTESTAKCAGKQASADHPLPHERARAAHGLWTLGRFGRQGSSQALGRAEVLALPGELQGPGSATS